MADKELPPLRVKIIGDDKSFRQMIARVSNSLTKLESRTVSINFGTATSDAQSLVNALNGLNMSGFLQQVIQTRGIVRSLAKVKMAPLDAEVDKIAKKFEKIDKIYRNLQKGAFAGSGGLGGSAAASLAAAAASMAKSLSDAIIKSSPHISRAVSQSLTTALRETGRVLTSLAPHLGRALSQGVSVGLRETGRVLTAITNQLGTTIRTLGTIFNAFNGVLRSAASVIASGANIFRSVANTAVAGLRAGASILSASIRAIGTNLSAAIRGASQVAAAAIRTAGQLASSSLAAVSRIVSATIQQGGRIAAQSIRTAGQVVSQAIRSAGQVAARAISAAVQGYSATTRMVSNMFATLGRTVVGLSRSGATIISTAIRSSGQVAGQSIRGGSQMGAAALRAAGQAISQAIRSSGTVAAARARASGATARAGMGGLGGMGGGLGQGLSNRADIYMHANAMQALAQSGKGLIDLRAELLFAEVGIRAFTGNAQQASLVMQEIKDHAEKTSFTRMGLTEATRNMMAYGLSAKDAISNIKMLGDVAGGNELRFERLSFAMSQITSMGRLQGQELRQLTEQGFNPLETMSRHTGISMLELKEMMEDGAISAAHVTEALKIETSAGGRFANQQKEMAKSLGGVRSQLIEIVKNIKTDLIKLIETELIKAMKLAIHYLKQFEAYMNTKQGAAFILRLVNMAKYAFAAAMAFHAVGLSMAILAWWIQSVGATMMRLSFVFTGVLRIASILVSVISSPFALAVAAIGLATWAVLTFTGTITGPDSAYDALLMLWQGVQWVFAGISGFFYNFSFNWMVISGFFRAQWKNIISDMLEGTARVIPAMLENFVTLLRMLGRMFVVFFTWIVTSYKGLFSGEVYEAIVNGFIKVFTWLENKWKDFGTFVGKIWENLFDPAALYDVLMQGMGLDQVAQDMTDDIATTMEKGLFAGLEGVVKDELSNLKTGLEGMEPETDFGVLNMLKLNAPPLPTPTAPELPDAGKYTGPGFKGLRGAGKDFKATEAMSASGSAYNKLLSEQAERMRSLRASPKQNPQVQQQVITNNLLKQLIQLTGGTPSVILQAAGVSTP